MDHPFLPPEKVDEFYASEHPFELSCFGNTSCMTFTAMAVKCPTQQTFSQPSNLRSIQDLLEGVLREGANGRVVAAGQDIAICLDLYEGPGICAGSRLSGFQRGIALASGSLCFSIKAVGDGGHKVERDIVFSQDG